jgi:hypothetical protein
VRKRGDAVAGELGVLAAAGVLLATAGSWHWWAGAAAVAAAVAATGAWVAADVGRRRVKAATAPLRRARQAADWLLEAAWVWVQQLALVAAGAFVAWRVAAALL